VPPTPSLRACVSRPPGSAAYDRIVSVTAADMSPGCMCRMWIRSCSWVVSVIIVYSSLVFADDEFQLSGPDRRGLRAPGELTNYVIASVTCLSVLPSVRPSACLKLRMHDAAGCLTGCTTGCVVRVNTTSVSHGSATATMQLTGKHSSQPAYVSARLSEANTASWILV